MAYAANSRFVARAGNIKKLVMCEEPWRQTALRDGWWRRMLRASSHGLLVVTGRAGSRFGRSDGLQGWIRGRDTERNTADWNYALRITDPEDHGLFLRRRAAPRHPGRRGSKTAIMLGQRYPGNGAQEAIAVFVHSIASRKRNRWCQRSGGTVFVWQAQDLLPAALPGDAPGDPGMPPRPHGRGEVRAVASISGRPGALRTARRGR